MLYRLSFFLMLFTIAACTPKMADTDAKMVDKMESGPTHKMVEYGEQAELALGESLRVRKTDAVFTFTSIVNDSRCPTGMNCVRAGEVKFLVTLADGSTRTVELPAQSRTQPSFSIPAGSVKVLGLTPYPVFDEKTEQGDYRLSVQVAKAVDQ